jgi:hypothetical protein
MTLPGNRYQHGGWFWIVAVVVSGLSAASQAQDTGFEGSLRIGYGIALGDIARDDSLSDSVSGQVPFALDLGYRVSPNLFIGLYGQYGIGILGGSFSDACDLSSQISCSAHDIRLGIEAHYHILPRQKLDPWLGLGFGYEWLGISISGGGNDASATFSGFEFVSLQAGLDIAVAQHFYLGPFLSLSLAEYSSTSLDCSGATAVCDGLGVSGDIQNKTLHEWLMLGVRATYAP